jgi:hypothetical protein
MSNRQKQNKNEDNRREAWARIEERLLSAGRRMERETSSELRHPSQAGMPDWRGADVQVTSNFGLMEGHDLLVRTVHAVPLAWLIFQVRDAFGDLLDASNKYGFYGSLAKAALDHLATHQPESDDARPLLRTVLKQAFASLEFPREHGYLPIDETVVFHGRDNEGRQWRSDLDGL